MMVSVTTGGALLALLALALLLSLLAGIRGDDMEIPLVNFDEPHPLEDWFDDEEWRIIQIGLLGWLVTLWAVWSVVFYLYLRNVGDLVGRIVSWLLKGSVLELLIAVPCHVFVRHREDCSAPAVTSFGIVTGIAVMLLSFGPSVLFLYKKRLDSYKRSGDVSD